MRRNCTIKWIQEEYGMPIHEILRSLYHNKELTVEELANRFLLTRSAAYRWLNQLGIKLKTNKMKYSKGKRRLR